MASADASPEGRAAVVCIGNVLMRDEGLGPLVARSLLETYDFPGTVDVLDAGTMGMSLLPDLQSHGFVVLVDAVDGTGQEPGTVFTYTPDEMAPNAIMHSLHDMRFTDVLAACRLMGIEPEAQCVGAQVLDMDPEDFSIGLTPPLEKAVPLVMATVVKILSDRGFTCITRRDGRPLQTIGL